MSCILNRRDHRLRPRLEQVEDFSEKPQIINKEKVTS